MKKLILPIFVILLFQFISVDAFECRVRDNCLAGENTIFYMYDNIDTHLSKTAWPERLCCTTEISNSCAANVKSVLFKLYSSSEGHVSQSPSSTYSNQICLSLANNAQGFIQCSYRENSNCNSDEKCIVTLSGNEDAHVSDCSSNGYNNKLCCKATVCPEEFRYSAAVGGCVVQFVECSNLDGFIQKGEARTCVNTPPYTDSENSCVTNLQNLGSLPYREACCFSTTYNGNDYYEYENIGVKSCTFEEIEKGLC